jgi:PAS domain S-box-containing protein
MHHLLPLIRDVINPHFQLIDKDAWASLSLSAIAVSVPKDTVFFLRDEEDIYYSRTPSVNQEPAALWAKSALANPHQPLEEIMNLLGSFPILLIQDEYNRPIGYLDSARVMQHLYRSYRHLQAYFETVLQTIDASVTVIDDKESVIVWTDGAEKLFSVTREEILGRPITTFFNIDRLEIMNTLKMGKTLCRHQHQPRSDLFVLINSNPVRFDDQIIGAVVSETDITNQVLLNKELFNASSKIHDLEQEVAKLKPSADPFHLIKGNSHALKRTKDLIKKVGSTDATVLILGESGVGKELFAKAIHNVRETAGAPFIPINCGAISPSLIESELFGYEKGAFSGADQKGKKGKIELAQGGTLFLDEIGEMPLDMQVKLLRVLQEKKYFPVGGTKEIQVDFRVVAATNRDLELLVKEEKFRKDLFYRLNVVSLMIPPLRQRKEDIIELTHYFLNEFSIRYNRPIHGISQHVMQDLLQHEWPGNIRELRNVIERLVVFATDGNIKREDFLFTNLSDEALELSDFTFQGSLTLQEELESYEKKVIVEALKHEKGNKQSCAKRLGVSRATLYNRMNKLGIPIS